MIISLIYNTFLGRKCILYIKYLFHEFKIRFKIRVQVLASRLFKQDLTNMTCEIFQELASRFFNEMNLQVLVTR
jgi:hypothetical protein